jgi:PAS domain-containing protein
VGRLLWEKVMSQNTSAPVADTARQPHRSIIEHVNDVVFQLDLEGCFTYLNPTSTELTGLAVDTFARNPVLRTACAEDRRHRQAYQTLTGIAIGFPWDASNG